MSGLPDSIFIQTLRGAFEVYGNQSTDVDEFPPDYQDTYDLGVKHGKIKTAKFLLGLMEQYLNENSSNI